MHTNSPFPLLLLPTLLLSLLPSAAPLGINCRGSFACADSANFFYESQLNVLGSFYDALNSGSSPRYPGGPINTSALYPSSRHIVCSKNVFGFGGICLFMQGNVPAEGVTGEVVLERLRDLVGHECNVCGSVPLSGDNDPAKMGLLTSNYVVGDACNGVCIYS